jgi:hypothetical protein
MKKVESEMEMESGRRGSYSMRQARMIVDVIATISWVEAACRDTEFALA